DEQAVRIEFWGDQVERITKFDPLTGQTITPLKRCAIYPATHYVVQRQTIERALSAIRLELVERLGEHPPGGKAPGGAAAGEPHELRYRHDAGDRHLRRDRELQPAPQRAARGGTPG